MTPDVTLLYSQISALLKKRSRILQQIGTNAETDSQTLSRQSRRMDGQTDDRPWSTQP